MKVINHFGYVIRLYFFCIHSTVVPRVNSRHEYRTVESFFPRCKYIVKATCDAWPEIVRHSFRRDSKSDLGQ